MKKNYTKRALISVLIPLVYVLTTIALILLAGVLEKPTNNSGIYIAVTLAAIFGMFSIPAVTLVCDVIGGIFSILALKNGGSRWKNALILAFALLSIAAAVVFAMVFWRGAMSV